MSSPATPPVRAWRAAFLSLRDETLTPPSPSALLHLFRSLLLPSLDALASAAPHLPSHEVTSDLTLLSDLALSIDLECPGAVDALLSIGHFIYAVCCKVHLEIQSTSWTSFVNIIEKVVSCSLSDLEKCKIFLKDSSRMDSIMEMSEVLRFLLKVHRRNCSLPENMHLIKVLLYIVSSLPTELLINFHTNIPSWNVIDTGIRVQLFALTGIGDSLSRLGSSVPVHLWQSTLEALRKLMDEFTSKNSPIENFLMSRFYAACLQCLHIVLSAPRASFSEHVSGFVAALQMFFTYGISFRPSMLPASSSVKIAPGSSSIIPGLVGSSKSVDGLYRPPHLRKQEVQQALKSQVSTRIESLKPGFTSSDSEQSDGDGFAKDDDHFRSSKVRLAALLCIQDICQVDPKSLSSLLTILLPTNDVLQPRKHQATMMTSLLFDPILKVRISSASAVASIVEAHTPVLLQVSELKEFTKCGSFMTLSTSLGQMLLQVHKGIMYLIQRETHTGFLASLLKVLMLLISATPYSRMPVELLPSIIVSITTMIAEGLSSSKIDLSIMASALSCMVAALSTSPSLHVLELLKKELPGGIPCSRESSSAVGISLLLAQGNYHPNIKLEALKVLQAIAHNYSYVTNELWEHISSIVLHNLQAHILEDASFNVASIARMGEPRNAPASCNDKCKVTSVKVLDFCLRGLCGFKGVDDPLEYKSADNQYTMDCGREIRVSSAPLFVSNGSDVSNGNDIGYSTGTKQWCEAIERHLPLILKHNSALMRAAGLTCFAGLTSSAFFSLETDKRKFIVSAVVDSALHDGVPSVRSAGCRALGVLSSFTQIFSSKRVLDDFIHAAEMNTHDPSLSVRITASWALANICDSLRRRETDFNLKTTDQLIDSNSISLLIENALQLTSDSDKVKANAVRALGNLSRFVRFNEYSGSYACATSFADDIHWLERMVQAFVSCVTTGNVKVQWNVCYSLGNLFLNPSVKLQSVSWSSSVYTILLLLLRESTNFKIRIHAAVALAVPSSRLDYGSSFSNIVQSILLVVENLDIDQSSVPSNAKYKDALEKQLALTTLHLLGYCSSDDAQALNSFFVKKASFLEEWLMSLCSKFSTSSWTDESDRKIGSGTSEPLVALLSKALNSLIEVYRCNNNPDTASRFQSLLDGVS